MILVGSGYLSLFSGARDGRGCIIAGPVMRKKASRALSVKWDEVECYWLCYFVIVCLSLRSCCSVPAFSIWIVKGSGSSECLCLFAVFWSISHLVLSAFFRIGRYQIWVAGSGKRTSWSITRNYISIRQVKKDVSCSFCYALVSISHVLLYCLLLCRIGWILAVVVALILYTSSFMNFYAVADPARLVRSVYHPSCCASLLCP